MYRTKHFGARMAQRGISRAMVDLVLAYGEESGDRIILGRKSAKRLLEDFRTLQKIVDKGGVAIVAQGNSLITAYNFEGLKH